MSSHRVHSILAASFEVTEIARMRGFTTFELDGVKGGPFRENGDVPAASILMDIVDPTAQAMLELLNPGQKLKVYFELEHAEHTPMIELSELSPMPATIAVPNGARWSTTAIQMGGQAVAV